MTAPLLVPAPGSVFARLPQSQAEIEAIYAEIRRDVPAPHRPALRAIVGQWAAGIYAEQAKQRRRAANRAARASRAANRGR